MPNFLQTTHNTVVDKMLGTSVKIQFIFRRFVRLRAYRKALIFWKLGTERHYFYTWMIWTETTISQRTVADARAQERKANFFARHVFEKTWMIPILRKWSKWGKDQVLERKLRNDSNARAMAFFKNHTQLIFFRQWKSNAKIMPFHRKKLVVVFLQCVDISSYNSTRHMRPVAKAVDQYNKTIRLRYRHAIFDVLQRKSGPCFPRWAPIPLNLDRIHNFFLTTTDQSIVAAF